MKTKEKSEFQTKENLIKNLNLDGRVELIERIDELGVDLESYVESVFFVSSTNSFWIDSYLVKDKKVQEILKYEKNTKLFN